nr:type I-E CRISPR-associated protein Cas6/Cse3/CasE [Streptomyces sp. DconLS]
MQLPPHRQPRPEHPPPRPSQRTASRPPERRSRQRKPPRGFRVAHRTAHQQLQWLLKRCERHGFTIPEATAAHPAPACTPSTRTRPPGLR